MKLINFLTDAKSGRFNPIVEALINLDLRAKEFSADVEEVRKLLGMNNSANDFALQAMLAVMNMYPEILHEIKESDLIGLIASYRKPEPFVAGARLVPTENQFSLYFKPEKIYKDLNLQISYVDASNLRITLDEDVWTVPYKYVVNLLSIEFPEALSTLKFQVEPFMDWQPGASFTVNLVPNSFPFKDVTNKLRQSDHFIRLANKFGLLDSFISNPEITYKLAIAGLVLYKGHEELV
jgi:hypothetical protein